MPQSAATQRICHNEKPHDDIYMGNVAAKPVRTAPARYVAKQLPRAPKDVEEEFAKAKLTILGINKMKEQVSTTPQPHVEVKRSEKSTQLTDMSPPRWYMNTWMELMDNTRQDRQILTGQIPSAWQRDHFEPYSLVRNRIDDEDLDWVLTEGKKMPIEELLKHTKLEREVLEDLLATVEAPRKQYRNYQGKIHRAIEDTNTFMADRSKRLEENRNEELLKQIGYSDEELEDEKQYMTNRSRGVKTLDDLGVSIRRKKRLDRFSEKNDMEILLEERRLAAIEAGTYEPTEDELERPDIAGVPKGQYYKSRFPGMKNTIRMDLSHDERDQKERDKIADWLDERKKVDYGKDKLPDDIPLYHEGLTQTEEQAKNTLDINTQRGMMLAKSTGAKKWADPRQQYDTMLKIMRDAKENPNDGSAPLQPPMPEGGTVPREHTQRVAMDSLRRAGYTPKAERAPAPAPPTTDGAAAAVTAAAAAAAAADATASSATTASVTATSAASPAPGAPTATTVKPARFGAPAAGDSKK